MMSQDQRPVTPAKTRGRPRVTEPRTSVSTWLPAQYHDRLIQLANLRDESVSATVRRLLILRLPAE